MRKPFNLKYVSSQGIEVDLTGRPYLWSVNNLSDYEWNVEAAPLRPSGIGAGRSRLTRGNQSKNVEIAVYRGDGESVYADVDYLLGVFETDVLRGQYGKLFIGQQYCEGYFTAAQHTIWKNNRVAKLALTFTTDYPFWIEEETLVLPIFSESALPGLKLPTLIPFHVLAPLGSVPISNRHYAPASSEITFFGPAVNPSVTVGSHIYTVSGILGDGERFVIDQKNRTVVKTTQSGEQINAFKQRGKSYSVFEPIPVGTETVYYSGEYAVEIKMLIERSKPTWSDKPLGVGDEFRAVRLTAAEYASITPVPGTYYFIEG